MPISCKPRNGLLAVPRWRQRRTTRRYSTALTAPINCGPVLKRLGWVQSHPDHSDILIPTATAAPALDAFEARIANRLNHPAFSKFGSVTVTAAEARGWSKAWTLEETVARSFALICQSARAEPIHNRCGARTDCCRGAGLPPDFECHRIEDIELIDIALFKRKKDTAFLLRDGPTEFEVPQ